MEGYYLLTITTALWCFPTVISDCNDFNCVVCNNEGNNCEKCNQGFTITSNGCSSCPKNCLTMYNVCTMVGNCQSCSPGFWGSHCLYTCPNNCDDDAGCEMTSGYCLKCEIGWYGPTCQQECSRCENEQCDSNKCSIGCKDGYVQDIYNNISYCLSCAPFCKTCSDTTFCTQCNSGYYIYQYTSPQGIVASCLNCSSVVPKCVVCTFDQNQFTCGSCDEGYAVKDNQCVTTVVCPHCQIGCDSEGSCFGGCEPGWTGTRCDYRCSYACETCINQDACLSCKDGFYTQTCNVPCNTNCQSGNYPRCRFGDGYCTNGCNKGFWGVQCENNCNNNCLDITAASELCHRNGTCYFGCKTGYVGSDCSQVTSISKSIFSSTPTTRSSTAKLENVTTLKTSFTQAKTDVNPTKANVQTISNCCINCPCSLGPAIGGSIAGGFVLGVLTAGVVFYLRERILQQRKDQTQIKNMYYNVSMSASHDEHYQSGTDIHQSSKDTELASASNQSEATLYEKLSERNKGNLYDHLEQPSENEIRQEIAEHGSNVEYYNN